jgi:hypothetical protein
MRKAWDRLGVSILVATAFMGLPGCGGGGGGGGNSNGNVNDNDNGSPGVLDFVLTDIPVHVQGRIEVGDDLIAYTDIDANRTPSEPNYLVPSAGDTVGRGIPGGGDFDTDSFKVSGKKIILSDETSERAFGITIFDTTDESFAPVPLEDIRLATIPIGNYAPGFIEVDGDFVVTRNDTPDNVDVKVVNIAAATPEVIDFTVNPSEFVAMVNVDSETRTAVAASSSIFSVYDIDNPGADPVEFDVSGFGGIDDDVQFAFDEGIILYVDDSSEGVVHILDISTPGNEPQTIATPNRGTSRVILRGSHYGFLYQGPSGQGLTAAIGVLPNLDPNISDGETVFENSANGGRFGYGDTIAVAAGASVTWFLGGRDDIGLVNPFQRSTNRGVSYSVTPDPRSPDDNLAAGDVVTNVDGSLLGFKHEANDEQFIGYLILD